MSPAPLAAAPAQQVSPPLRTSALRSPAAASPAPAWLAPSPPPRPLFQPPAAFYPLYRTLPPAAPSAGQGLANLGNTCYANAVLSALAALGALCDDLAADALGAALFRGALPRDGCVAALRDALGALRSAPSAGGAAPVQALSRQPERVLAAAAAAGGAQFRRGAQQDAHEFLLHLLDRTAAETAKAHASGALQPQGAPPLRRTRCPVRRSFTAVLAVSLTCEQCGACATQRELCRALPLEVPPDGAAPDLPALLAAFFAPERGVERACAGCGHGRATLRRRLQRPPRVLLLQLKRFRASAPQPAAPGAPQPPITLLKCCRRVAAPPQLSLAPHVGGAGAPRPPPAPGPPLPPRPAPPAAAAVEDAEEACGDSDAVPARAAEAAPAASGGAASGEHAPRRAGRADGESAPPYGADAAECLSDSSDAESSPRDAASQRGAENVALSYRLVAQVAHVGPSAASGHYTADCWDAAGQRWRRHDDARVTACAEADVFGPAAQETSYLLFYEHVRQQPERKRASPPPLGRHA